jgi:hypothetical protein
MFKYFYYFKYIVTYRWGRFNEVTAAIVTTIRPPMKIEDIQMIALKYFYILKVML